MPCACMIIYVLNPAIVTKLSAIFIVLLSSLCFTLPARADSRGDMTLGLGAGYTSANHSAYTDIYFRYTFAGHVRIAPSTGIVYKHEGASNFHFNIDMQFPFAVARGLQIYPLAGVAFNNWNYTGGDTYSRFGANLGGGIDLKFTRSLRLTIQANYTFMKHTDGVYVGAGIGYNF